MWANTLAKPPRRPQPAAGGCKRRAGTVRLAPIRRCRVESRVEMPTTDEPRSPRHAQPAEDPVRPSLAALAPGRSAPDRAPERDEPRIEIVEAPGLRWINVERPRAPETTWLEEHFDFHRSTSRTSVSRNQRPKVDEYDDYLFIVLHFPRYDKTVSRLNAAELDLFVGPDYLITIPNEPLQPVEYLFERCRTNEELRESLFSKGPGYLLYRIVDDCVDASFPMLRKMGNKLERIEEDIFEDAGRTSCATSPTSSRRSSTSARSSARSAPAFRDLERTKQRYIADDLDIYFDDIVDASERIWDMLENYKEVVEGARVHQRVGDLPSRQRDLPDPDRDHGDRPAADADRLDLGHERQGSRRGLAAAFYMVVGSCSCVLVGSVVLPPPRLALTCVRAPAGRARRLRRAAPRTGSSRPRSARWRWRARCGGCNSRRRGCRAAAGRRDPRA